MPADNLTDVPVPAHHNFRDMEDARAWTEQSMVQRPWRVEFFDTFARELRDANTQSVLEIGSGPGFLARRVLEALPQVAYTALDFSPAMHLLARERLGDLASRVQFLEGDFRQSGWQEGLPVFDAVLSMQSAHEVRHKLRIPALYVSVRRLLRHGGIFLVCDVLPDPEKPSGLLHMTTEEQRAALEQAGFNDISILLKKGGLGMLRARNL